MLSSVASVVEIRDRDRLDDEGAVEGRCARPKAYSFQLEYEGFEAADSGASPPLERGLNSTAGVTSRRGSTEESGPGVDEVCDIVGVGERGCGGGAVADLVSLVPGVVVPVSIDVSCGSVLKSYILSSSG